MMMKRKCLFLIVLCLLAVFTACSSRRAEQKYVESSVTGGYSLQPEEPPPVERRVFVALGDSVSAGYGINSPEDRFTTIFYEMLKSAGFVNEYVNFAVSGYTTTDLLRQLTQMPPHDLSRLRDASVITLNIGGNNILAPFLDYLPDIDEVGRIANKTIAFATESWALALEIMEFVNESRDAIEEMMEFATDVMEFAENFGFFDIFRLGDIMNAAPAVIEDTMAVFSEVTAFESAIADMFGRTSELELLGLISLLSGTFSPELEAEMQKGIDVFAQEFSEILTWLEANAPNAVIIVNTVYNPLPAQFLGIPLGFSDESQRLIQSINTIIYEEGRGRGLIVSDIYSKLSHRLDMMNLNFDIIHPNPDGHNLMAELIFDDFIQGALTQPAG